MQTPRNSMKKMLIKNSTLLVIWGMLSFLSCGSLLAQEKLNLEEVKEAALSYSHDIKNGKIRIEQAEAATHPVQRVVRVVVGKAVGITDIRAAERK